MEANNECLVCSNKTLTEIYTPRPRTRYCDSCGCMIRYTTEASIIVTIRSKDTHYSVCQTCYERCYGDPFWCIDHQYNYCHICDIYTSPQFQLVIEVDNKPRSFLSACTREHFDILCNKMVQLRANNINWCKKCTINYTTANIQFQSRTITYVSNSWLTTMPFLSWLGFEDATKIEETTF